MDATPLRTLRVRVPNLLQNLPALALHGSRQHTLKTGPFAGLMCSASLALLPWAGWLPMGALYAALILGMGAMFLALCPSSTRGVRMPLLMAALNFTVALSLHETPAGLYAWLIIQTGLTGAGLLRERDRDAAELMSVLLGLNAGAAAGLGLSL